MANNTSLLDHEEDECEYELTSDMHVRFPLLVVTLMLVSFVGVTGNVLAILVFSRKRMQSSGNWFQMAISAAHTGVLIITVLLYSVEVLMDYTLNYTLYRMWFSYAQGLYATSHVFIVSTSYLTVSASIERYYSLTYPSRAKRYCNGFGVFLFVLVTEVVSVLLNLTRYFEIEVVKKGQCAGTFGEFSLAPGVLLRDPVYHQLYSVWLSNILFIFFPFLALVFGNAVIIIRQKKINDRQVARELENNNEVSSNSAGMMRKLSSARRRREDTKEATLVLVVLVFVFLLCNSPEIILVVLESLAPQILQSNRKFYGYARDSTNCAAVLYSAVDIFIYITYSRRFRYELSRMLMCRKRDAEMSLSSWTLNGSAIEAVGSAQRAAVQHIAMAQMSMSRETTEHKARTLSDQSTHKAGTFSSGSIEQKGGPLSSNSTVRTKSGCWENHTRRHSIDLSPETVSSIHSCVVQGPAEGQLGFGVEFDFEYL